MSVRTIQFGMHEDIVVLEHGERKASTGVNAYSAPVHRIKLTQNPMQDPCQRLCVSSSPSYCVQMSAGTERQGSQNERMLFFYTELQRATSLCGFMH